LSRIKAGAVSAQADWFVSAKVLELFQEAFSHRLLVHGLDKAFAAFFDRPPA
jgi:hypothetical protein